MWDSVIGLFDKVVGLLGEEQTFNMLAGAALAFYAWVQRKVGIDRKEKTVLNDALGFLEAGVAKTYQVYVKARKDASADGHLTVDEKRQARELALMHAKDYAAKEGISLIKTLGTDMIPVLIEKAVGGLKKEAGGVVVNGTGDGTVQPVVVPTVQPTVDGYGTN